MAASPTTNITFQNFFSTTLTSDITSSATDIFLNAVPNGSEGFLVIEPDSSNREVIYYNSKTALKVVCPSAADGRGQDDTSAVAHSQGATVIMAPIAAYFETLLSLFTTSPQGWTALSGTFSVASGYNSGGKIYTIDTSTDQSSILSPGMRFKLSRGTTPPTQCTDLESSSSQYAKKTTPSGISFTDDFTCEAWVKLESYTGAVQTIVSRYTTSGFLMFINASGQLAIQGGNGAADDICTTYQSIPLNQWVHVAGTLDMSGATGTTYINGVSVANVYTNSAATSLTQAGDLEIGAYNGATGPFDGKIADVRVWSAVRTATQIRDNMNQQLTGSETNLVGYFKLDGNFNDSTSNANNMTGQNSAVATSTDNPMNSTEYGIITKVTSTQVTVFTGVAHNIPNMTLSSPYYSTYKTPFNFPNIPPVIARSLTWGNFSDTTVAGVDVPAYSLTVDVPAGKGLRIRVFGMHFKTGSAGDANGIFIYEDSASIFKFQFNMAGSNYGQTVNLVTPIFRPTTGSHTYKVRMDASAAGTMQFGSTGINGVPGYMEIEVVDL